jgi:SsrA-binding protein
MVNYANNSKARFDYEILHHFSAGIQLAGHEVKSVRTGKITLNGSFVTVRGGEVFLTGAEISPYQPKNLPRDYDTRRPRKLLLTKKEIEELTRAEGTKGLTIIPIKLYNKERLIKLDIAIVRGKKKFDKRQSIMKRDTEREIDRTLKK